MLNNYGLEFRAKIHTEEVISFIGVYDAFSAAIAAKQTDALFLGGRGFAASFYGVQDSAFISWSDLVTYVQRVRTILPQHHLLVDIDDGYGDQDVASYVVKLVESVGASGIVLSDQRRPRRHCQFDESQLMELDSYLSKLDRVLEARSELFVIARTNSTDPDDIVKRVTAFARVGADAVLVEGLTNPGLIRELKQLVPVPIAFNQTEDLISPDCDISELCDAGVSLVIHSALSLAAAQTSILSALLELELSDSSSHSFHASASCFVN